MEESNAVRNCKVIHLKATTWSWCSKISFWRFCFINEDEKISTFFQNVFLLLVEITLWHECSPVNLLHIFRTRLEHLWMAASEPATSPTQKEGFFCKSITAQKMKFSIKDFPIKYDQIRRKLRLLEKPLMENFILCAVNSWKNNRKCLKIIRSQL